MDKEKMSTREEENSVSKTGQMDDDRNREVEIRTPSGYIRKAQLIGAYAFSGFERGVFKNYTEDMEKIRNFPIRPDDILLVSYPKSGSNWSSEILKMMKAGKACYHEKLKINEMIDHQATDYLEALKSPRVLNSHAKVQDIPKGILENKCKIVLVVRNPKDTCVSQYNQLVGFNDFDGTWEDFVYLFSESEYPPFHDWFTYTRDAINFAKAHDFVYILNFEDLKENSFKEIQKLAKFLDVVLTEETAKEIAEKCSFTNLKEARKEYSAKKTELFPNYELFRKGTVGDWKNWFTVAQSERFDTVYQQKMQGCDYQFRYCL